MNKKGISEIVSTVLIIAMTVVAVGIITAWVIPMIKTSIDRGSACLDAQSDISLVTDSGNICINSTATNATIYFQIRKGANTNVNLIGIQAIVSIGGNTESQEITTGLPGINGERVMKITSAKYINATSIKIAPMVTVGKTKSLCEPTREVALIACS